MSDTNICEFLESNEASFVLVIEDQRKSGGKAVLLSQANSSIIFLTNSSPSYLEYYFKELKLFLNAYAFYEIIVGVLCTIFQTCDLCLIDVLLSNCLSIHDSFRNQVLTRDAKLEQYCFDLKCWHDILDVVFKVVDSFPSWAPMCSMILNFLDSFVGKFLAKKVEGHLYSLIEDLLDKSIRIIVETYSYILTSFETFVIALKGISPFENHFLNVKVQLENPCDNPKFLFGLEVLKTFLNENILGFQFYHLHFKEYMFLLIFENKKKDGFGVRKVCHRVFVETILRKDFLELLFKSFVEKHLCYFKTFIEIFWKDVFLNGFLVPNKDSFVISMKHEIGGTLLYYLPLKEFLKKFICEEKLESLGILKIINIMHSLMNSWISCQLIQKRYT
ncbi:hypothetical protein M9H77_30662 [Catharanthus roseus]|uniref:Uncharacterized protein n=1 Tax=Catharanthus roseus TaxID=4058 RepID=A0ACB9ZYX8_CATRO|nr:hypothetical protein M9H77_30662 [Catharanthus roseus]